MGEVTPKDTLKILRKELFAGLGTALALGYNHDHAFLNLGSTPRAMGGC